jgi:hypothetical protein
VKLIPKRLIELFNGGLDAVFSRQAIGLNQFGDIRVILRSLNATAHICRQFGRYQAL